MSAPVAATPAAPGVQRIEDSAAPVQREEAPEEEEAAVQGFVQREEASEEEEAPVQGFVQREEEAAEEEGETPA
jgi:hypothetical protein